MDRDYKVYQLNKTRAGQWILAEIPELVEYHRLGHGEPTEARMHPATGALPEGFTADERLTPGLLYLGL